MEVLDLFSAAAGGWSLGMHRAGFKTIAACESVDWRRALYQENNPGVRIYDDVRTLTANQLLRDFGRLPSIVVGSPPCQDISSANTKGKGVEGERSGLYFEAVRIIGEVRPRWFALENSSNLRTRGADAVLAALEALGYACWSFVVRAGDIGANHERPRCWVIGCDIAQVTDTAEARHAEWTAVRRGRQARDQHARDHASKGQRRMGNAADIGPGHVCEHGIRWPWACDECDQASYPSKKRSEDGSLVGSLCSQEIAEIGRPNGRGHETRNDANAVEERPERVARYHEPREGEVSERADISPRPEVGLCAADRWNAESWRSDWTLDDLTGHLQLDDGLSSWLAGTRVALGTPKGTSAASLIVEAFGDAVVPQIPEAIGKAILRTEAALSAIYGRTAA